MQPFKRYLIPSEQKKLLAAMKEAARWEAQRDYHASALMLCTGIRVGTLVGLTVRDAVNAISDDELVIRDEIAKRKRGYTIQLSRKAKEHLRALVSIRRTLGLGLDQDAPLLVARVRSRGGEGMTVRAVQKRIKAWRERAGIAVPVTPHFFRHTCGQQIVRKSTAQNPLVAAAAMLGHSDINSTAIYTRPSREDMKLVAEEVSA